MDIGPDQAALRAQPQIVLRQALAIRLSPLAPNTPIRVERDGQKIEEVPWPSGKARIRRFSWP